MHISRYNWLDMNYGLEGGKGFFLQFFNIQGLVAAEIRRLNMKRSTSDIREVVQLSY